MFIDIHNHLNYYGDEKISKIVERARKENVNYILVNGTDVKSNRKILELDREYEEVKVALGVYPMECLEMGSEKLDDEISFIRDNKEHVKAIGEVGMDLKEAEPETLEQQKENLSKFVKLSMELDIPIIVHSRKAEKETIELLEDLGAKKVIMHCFFGSRKLIKRIIDNGWYLTVPTCVCYNNQMQELVELVPVEKMFCETDSPYMHPGRAKNNEPSLVIESYKKVAEIKQISLNELENTIEENLKSLFLSE